MENVRNLPINIAHNHLTKKQVVWYCNTLNNLSHERRNIDDLFILNRIKADKIHQKRSSCKICYENFSREYYRI